jgi:hypothetical protein
MKNGGSSRRRPPSTHNVDLQVYVGLIQRDAVLKAETMGDIRVLSVGHAEFNSIRVEDFPQLGIAGNILNTENPFEIVFVIHAPITDNTGNL